MTLSEKMFSKRFHGCTCLKCFMSLKVTLPPQYYQGIFGRFLIIVRNCTIPHSYRICVGFQRYSGTTGKPEISRVMFRIFKKCCYLCLDTFVLPKRSRMHLLRAMCTLSYIFTSGWFLEVFFILKINYHVII